ncbi:MAG TPA: hypothetical protein VG013_38135 [Gemmataceae bacterium]|jgi:hypothetical protein|nr:hypothetical protein [Gemmataceae bacterium]
MPEAKRRSQRPYLDEREQQIEDDYEWCLHDPGVRQKYAGKVVVVQRRKIWGVGKNHAAAWAAALRKRGCPSKDQIAIVVVPEAGPPPARHRE